MWHVATFLAANTTLLQLDIANNNIGGMCALVVLHALAKNKCLQQLDLRRNATYALSFSKLFSNINQEAHLHAAAEYLARPRDCALHYKDRIAGIQERAHTPEHAAYQV